ncbi:hypothetical protein H6P81_009569 [Aristolochia fimbriata]|uniref:Period n=1 Tax=Aristolochia fimbriata TaxID=158543 RepID=A0AAV7EMG3_ARIFI|nr:hypothetical protein H6P81_009569 [Aristolochia fimbriata]
MEKQVLHLEVESLEYTLRKIQEHVINICTKDPEQLLKALEVQQPCQIVSRELSEVLNEGINVDPKDPADYNHSEGKGFPLCQEHSLVTIPYQDKHSLESSASRLGGTDHQSTVDNVPNHSTDKGKGSSCNSSVHQVDSESSTT